MGDARRVTVPFPEYPEKLTVEHCRALLAGPPAVVHDVTTVVMSQATKDGPVMTRTGGWLWVVPDGALPQLGALPDAAWWPWATWRVGRDAVKKATYFVLGEDRLERQWEKGNVWCGGQR